MTMRGRYDLPEKEEGEEEDEEDKIEEEDEGEVDEESEEEDELLDLHLLSVMVEWVSSLPRLEPLHLNNPILARHSSIGIPIADAWFRVQ